MQLRQHAVHSNGTQTITYTGCVNTETGYTKCSNTGCSNYSQSGCSNHTNYGKSSYSQSGCSNHTNYSKSSYSQSGCSNHTNYSKSSYSQSGYSNHSNSSSGGCNWGNWSDGVWGNDYCGNGGWSKHSNSGCGNHTNYSNSTYSQSGYSNHTNYSNSTYSQSGYSNHTNYSNSTYSQSGYSNHTNTGYTNHSNTSTTTWTYTNSAASSSSKISTINSNIPSYLLNSSLSDKGVNLATNTIVLDLSSAYSGGQKYRIYVRRASLGSTVFSDWQLVTEQGQISTFSVDISTWSQGKVQFAVTAYNGSSWSAILSDNNWTYDHYQSLTPSDNTVTATVFPSTSHTSRTGTTTTRTVVTVSDTTKYEVDGGSYALSDILQIIRYTPPTWLTDPYAKATTQQLQDEINKALDVYTGATYVFASSPIVCNWTVITLNNLSEMQTQTNNILTAAGKSTVDFSSKDYMSGTSKISPDKALKDLQDLLDSLGE